MPEARANEPPSFELDARCTTLLMRVSVARRQGSAVPGTLIEGPDAWYAKDYAGTEKHIYRLSEQDLVELDAAVAGVEASGIDIKVGGPTNVPHQPFTDLLTLLSCMGCSTPMVAAQLGLRMPGDAGYPLIMALQMLIFSAYRYRYHAQPCMSRAH